MDAARAAKAAGLRNAVAERKRPVGTVCVSCGIAFFGDREGPSSQNMAVRDARFCQDKIDVPLLDRMKTTGEGEFEKLTNRCIANLIQPFGCRV